MFGRNYDSQGLFRSNGRLQQYIDNKIGSAVSEARTLGSEVFEANSDEDIVDHIVSKYPIKKLELYEDQKEARFDEVSVDAWNYPNRMLFDDSKRPFPIPGYRLSWKIPTEGSEELFHLEPNQSIMNTIVGEIDDRGLLVVSTEQPADTANEQSLETTLSNQVSTIRRMVEYSNNDLANFDRSLRDQVSSAVGIRKQELDKILKLKTALKVNIEKKRDATPLNNIEVKVQQIKPLSTKKEDPGAYISDNDYEQILQAIRNMGASMETSRASESRDEESLRDMLLVGLNASMSSGVAGAELFRKKGKTDINIIFDNKAAFVGECKLWKGDKYMLEGIDQLLGYLTWRDAKTSIIIFNRHNKNFSEIQSKVGEAITTHKDYVKSIPSKNGEWRFVFRKPDDENRQIVVHVFLFDVYDGSSGEE